MQVTCTSGRTSTKYFIVLSSSPQHGLTPLIVATQEEHTEIVQLLVERKANCNLSEEVSGAYSLIQKYKNCYE